MSDGIKYQERYAPDSSSFDMEEYERKEREEAIKRERELKNKFRKKRIQSIVKREMKENEPQYNFDTYEDYLNFAVLIKESCARRERDLREQQSKTNDHDKKVLRNSIFLFSAIFVGSVVLIIAITANITSLFSSSVYRIIFYLSFAAVVALVIGYIFFLLSKVEKYKTRKHDQGLEFKEKEKAFITENAKRVKYLFNEDFLQGISDVPDDVSFVSGLPATDDNRYIVYTAFTGNCYHTKPWCRGNYLSPVNYFSIRDKLQMCSFCGKRFNDIEWYDKYNAMKNLQQFFVDRIPDLRKITKSP